MKKGVLYCMLFILAGAAGLFAGHYRATPVKNRVYLPKETGLPWVIVLADESMKWNAITSYAFYGPDNGYAVGSIYHDLMRFADGKWEIVSFPDINSANPAPRLFGISKQKLWLSIQSPIPYKQNLLFRDGEKSSIMHTPNTAGILGIWMDSETHGWAGCEWGQILRYDGRNWTHVFCPVMDHINRIIPAADNQWLAMTKNTHEMLHYDGSAWRILEHPDTESFEQFVIAVQTVGHLEPAYAGLHQYRALLDHFLQKPAPADTLILDGPVYPGHYMWAHADAAVTGGRGSLRKDFLHTADDETVFVILEKSALIRGNTREEVWAFFSRNGLERRLSVRMAAAREQQETRPRFTLRPKSMPFVHGISIGDISGNGYEDMYLVNNYGHNTLHVYRESAGTRERSWNVEMAYELGISGKIRTPQGRPQYEFGAASADIDNSGRQALLVTSAYGRNILYVKGLSSRFKEKGVQRGVGENIGFSMSGAWGDVNNDGFIDLLISNENNPNRLYLNNGAGYFTDITLQAGLHQARGGGGSVMADVNNNGRLDIFIPRRGTRNLLFINNECPRGSNIPVFTEEGIQRGIAGADTIAHSVCGVFADVNNNGYPDLFVANMTGSNRLYLNDGSGFFTDVTEQSGLKDADMSVTAVFFDADHNGYLDLYTGNRGKSRFYKNLGNARFEEQTEAMNAGYEGYVTGMAVWDKDMDGDLDVFIADSKTDTHELLNEINNNNWIKLRLKGTRSNRDAVGAKAWMYTSGSAGIQDSLLASRHVESGGNYTGMNSRVLHFGVPNGKVVDVVIRFPSGIIREFTGMEPGQLYTIYEQDGWARRLAYTQKGLIRIVRSPVNQREAAFLAGFLLVMLLIHLFLFRAPWWQVKIIHFSFSIPVFVFTVFYMILFDKLSIVAHLLPVGISLFFCATGILYGRRIWGVYENESEIKERLFFGLKRFFHGGWGARKLNRMLFCLENLEPVTPEKLNILEESIQDYFTILLPEIERIVSAAASLRLEGNCPDHLRDECVQLCESLNVLKIEARTEKIKEKMISKAMAQIRSVEHHLKTLRKSIFSIFSTDIRESIHGICAEAGIPDACDFEKDEALFGIIRPAEFSQIFSNLLNNAAEAARSRTKKRIAVFVKANSDLIEIEVSDNGEGVPHKTAAFLFTRQVNSTTGGSGFGLYMAARTLEKYGGTIELKQNKPEIDTVFLVKLKRIIND